MIGTGILALLACPGSGDDTGIGRQDARIQCSLDEENGLRATCEVILPSPAPVTLTVSAPGEPTRTFSSPEARDHTLTAWGLTAETLYTWELYGDSGTFETRPLPEAFDALEVTVTGEPQGFDLALHSLPCGDRNWFVMFDGAGRVQWFQEAEFSSVDGRSYDWVPESRSLMTTTDDLFVEFNASGQELLRLEQGTHFEDELHHDVSRWGPYTYLLTEYTENGKNLDRVDVFEDTTLLGSWRLSDTYDVASNPNSGGEEWSHGNGLNVTEDGQAIFSTLSFSAAVAFDADPSSPTFLEHQFLATGVPNSLPDPDYTPLSADAGFGQQHAIHRVGDELWLFDNTGDGFRSRGLRLSLEHGRNGLAMLEEWPMGESCRAQGGAYPLDGGGMLATCAPSGDVWAFAAGQQAPVWTLNAWCGENEDSPIRFPKGVPITVQ